ncbi:MAG: hypothetical protein JNM93_02000 [Bacteriovoracaceae bacterium]|nr:hypothetical protein [Bacteriovoracaceae bacterium]
MKIYLLLLLTLFSCGQDSGDSSSSSHGGVDGLSSFDISTLRTNRIAALYPFEIRALDSYVHHYKKVNLGTFVKDENYYRQSYLNAMSKALGTDTKFNNFDTAIFMRTHMEIQFARKKLLADFIGKEVLEGKLIFKLKLKMKNYSMKNIQNIRMKLQLLDENKTVVGISQLKLKNENHFNLEQATFETFQVVFKLNPALRAHVHKAGYKMILSVDEFDYQLNGFTHKYSDYMKTIRTNNYHLFYLTNNSYDIYSLNKQEVLYPVQIIQFIFPYAQLANNEIKSLTNTADESTKTWFLHTSEKIVQLNESIGEKNELFVREIPL